MGFGYDGNPLNDVFFLFVISCFFCFFGIVFFRGFLSRKFLRFPRSFRSLPSPVLAYQGVSFSGIYKSQKKGVSEYKESHLYWC